MIDLSSLPILDFEPRFMDWGVAQDPAMGGVAQRYQRIGSRFAVSCSMPPMPSEAAGRKAIALLQRAKQQGARLVWRQGDLPVGSPGSPTVNGGVAGGMTLPIIGASAAYTIREGQALNVVRNGRRYLYFAAQDVTTTGGGGCNIVLTSPLRTQLAGGEAVVLAAPVIEGWLEGQEVGWTLNTAMHVGLSFSMTERA